MKVKRLAGLWVACALVAGVLTACGGQPRPGELRDEDLGFPATSDASGNAAGSGQGGTGGAASSSARGGAGSAIDVIDDLGTGTSAGASGSAGAAGSGANPSAGTSCERMRPFDPAEVYVVGSLLEGTAGADVIFHWTNPNVAVAGFGEGLNTGKIRPSDGAVIMQEGIPIRVFHEDDCVVRTDQRYPTDPYANDELLDRHCNDDGLSGFRLAPDGSIVFFCREGARSADGQILYDRPESANAYDGERFLTAVGVFDIATQELHPFVNLPMSDFNTRTISIRVQPSGFWVATASGTTRGQLWLVDYQGGVQAVGDYPASTAEGSRSAAQLGADGALFEIVYAGAGGNFIERRTLAGDIEVVYDERKNPLVKLQNSTFVSGP